MNDWSATCRNTKITWSESGSSSESNESQCFWQTFNVSQAFELGVYQIHLARISRSETLHKVIHSVRRSTLVLITPSRSVSTRCVPSVRRSRFWCSAQGNILTLQILVPKLFRFMLLANSSRLEPSASVSLSQRYPNPNSIYELEFNLQVHRGHCVLSTDHEAL